MDQPRVVINGIRCPQRSGVTLQMFQGQFPNSHLVEKTERGIIEHRNLDFKLQNGVEYELIECKKVYYNHNHIS
jgi:hypothetical protein